LFVKIGFTNGRISTFQILSSEVLESVLLGFGMLSFKLFTGATPQHGMILLIASCRFD